MRDAAQIEKCMQVTYIGFPNHKPTFIRTCAQLSKADSLTKNVCERLNPRSMGETDILQRQRHRQLMASLLKSLTLASNYRKMWPLLITQSRSATRAQYKHTQLCAWELHALLRLCPSSVFCIPYFLSRMALMLMKPAALQIIN